MKTSFRAMLVAGTITAFAAVHAKEAGAEPVVSSWHGFELEGSPTTSGEPHRPDGRTATHRSLPLGTELLVSYGGRQTVVRASQGTRRGRRLSARAPLPKGLGSRVPFVFWNVGEGLPGGFDDGPDPDGRDALAVCRVREDAGRGGRRPLLAGNARFAVLLDPVSHSGLDVVSVVR
jgi:hypothetical protein